MNIFSIPNKNVTKIVRRKDMYNILFNLKGSHIISFVYETTPNLNPTNNPYFDKTNNKWNLSVFRKVNAMVNFNYSKAKEKRLGKTKSKSQKSWHEPILNNSSFTPFVKNKKDESKLYLRYMTNSVVYSKYIDDNGNEIDVSQYENTIKIKNTILDFKLLEWNKVKLVTINKIDYVVI